MTITRGPPFMRSNALNSAARCVRNSTWYQRQLDQLGDDDRDVTAGVIFANARDVRQ